MCIECGELVGAIVACAWRDCRNLFVVCESCNAGQLYCSKSCRQAARQFQLRRTRREYLTTPHGKILRSKANQRYRLRVAKKVASSEMDHPSTQDLAMAIDVPDEKRATSDSPVRATEGPGHDVLLQVCRSPESQACPVADRSAVGRQCAQGAVDSQPPATASDADIASKADAVQRPSLEHCRFCGAPVRLLVDREALGQRIVQRRKAARSTRRRRARPPTVCWSG